MAENQVNAQQDISILEEISSIIWDVDDTLYKVCDTLTAAFHRASARAAISLGLAISEEEAMQMAMNSYLNTGADFTYFTDHHGLDLHALGEASFPLVDETIIIPYEGFSDMFELTKQTTPYFQHLALSHGYRHWVDRVLKRVSLKQHFHDSHILGLDDVGGIYKFQSENPFLLALDILADNADNVVMVEDSLRNLAIPHDLGLTTVFLNHGTPLETRPEFVDLEYSDAPIFLKDLIRHQKFKC